MFRPSDLSTSDFQIRIRTSGSGSSDEPRTSRSSSKHSPLSLLLPPPPSPDLPTVTMSDPLPSSAPGIWPGCPEPVTSALAPLSLPYPVVRIPSSDFRAPDSQTPRPVFQTPDPFLQTSGTSGRPLVVPSSFIGLTNFSRAFTCLLCPPPSGLRPPCLGSGPVSCPYSRTRTGVPSSETSGPFRSLLLAPQD
ncbi:hypothetical protein K438DRAFT_1973600 [Mycena galopus ATCC 62051]|nr:hypothetical protein K438DRAFT_1973600 [Mycena galopus ATCC 62051]